MFEQQQRSKEAFQAKYSQVLNINLYNLMLYFRSNLTPQISESKIAKNLDLRMKTTFYQFIKIIQKTKRGKK